MASNYTEESLISYNNQQLIKQFLEVQQSNETISKLTNEIKLLKENYEKLESEISVPKTVSSLLTDQINNVKRQCWENAQYSRRECLEVVGIPSSEYGMELVLPLNQMILKLAIGFIMINKRCLPDSKNPQRRVPKGI